jgi:hypothetical protein
MTISSKCVNLILMLLNELGIRDTALSSSMPGGSPQHGLSANAEDFVDEQTTTSTADDRGVSSTAGVAAGEGDKDETTGEAARAWQAAVPPQEGRCGPSYRRPGDHAGRSGAQRAATDAIPDADPLQWDIPTAIPVGRPEEHDIPQGSDQCPGEHPWAYFRKKRAHWVRDVQNESVRGRQARQEREAWAKELGFPGEKGGELYQWEPAGQQRWTRQHVCSNAASTVWARTPSVHKKYDSIRNVWELWRGFCPNTTQSTEAELDDALGDEEGDALALDTRIAKGEQGSGLDSWPQTGTVPKAETANAVYAVTSRVAAKGGAIWLGEDRQESVKLAAVARALLSSAAFSRTGDDPLHVKGLMKQYAEGGTRQRLQDRYVVARCNQ